MTATAPHTMTRMTSAEQLRSRLLGYRPSDVVWGWAGPLSMAFVGGIMRFWSLGRPDQLVFDETYYVKQGVSMLLYGVEMRVPDSLKKPDELFTNGTPDVFGTEGDLVVHPLSASGSSPPESGCSAQRRRSGGASPSPCSGPCPSS